MMDEGLTSFSLSAYELRFSRVSLLFRAFVVGGDFDSISHL